MDANTGASASGYDGYSKVSIRDSEFNWLADTKPNAEGIGQRPTPSLLAAAMEQSTGSVYPVAVKIALVILHADAARGGAERYTLDLAGSLSRRGHAVSILASSFQGGETAGQRVLLAATGKTRTGRYLSFLNAMETHLSVGGYDIVHAMLPVRQCDVYHPHAGIAVEAVAAGHLNKSGRVNQALAWMGNRGNVRRQKFAAVERALLCGNRPPVVLCLSRLIQSVVRRHYPGLAEEKLVSLFNGIDLGRFDPAKHPEARLEVRSRFQIPDSANVGLTLAQDFERKGVRQLIEALARIPDPRLILLIGGKPDPAKYRRLAQNLNVADRVLFAGPVENPVTFYQAADFFVLPTRFDPCSLVVLEALAMGVAVISTVKNGACEIMQDDRHGRILADPDDILALAEAMSGMLDAERRSRISCACLELRPKLSQDWHVDCIEAIYVEIMRKRAAAHGK